MFHPNDQPSMPHIRPNEGLPSPPPDPPGDCVFSGAGKGPEDGSHCRNNGVHSRATTTSPCGRASPRRHSRSNQRLHFTSMNGGGDNENHNNSSDHSRRSFRRRCYWLCKLSWLHPKRFKLSSSSPRSSAKISQRVAFESDVTFMTSAGVVLSIFNSILIIYAFLNTKLEIESNNGIYSRGIIAVTQRHRASSSLRSSNKNSFNHVTTKQTNDIHSNEKKKINVSERGNSALAVNGQQTYSIFPNANQNISNVAHDQTNINAAHEEEGISACLLINDENPRLPEWIAYHYLTLPLRHLIVAVDPASRSSPNEILEQWFDMFEVRVWSDTKYLPPKLRGPCPYGDDADKCLWHHRHRQQHFVMKCMAEFQRQKRTWVLLTDVDEYIVFNGIAEDDPVVPLDEAPQGIPVMADWRYHKIDNGSDTARTGFVDGWVDGKFTRYSIYPKKNETIWYGSVVTDDKQNQLFLRDDIAYYEDTALREALPGVPTLKEPDCAGKELYGRVYNDTYDTNYADGQFIQVPMDWEIGDANTRRTFYGGHIIWDKMGRRYFIENEHELWPPHYSAKDSIAARARLPSIGDGRTILDVLKGQDNEEGYARGGGSLAPCVTMPRVLYGSREDNNENRTRAAPDGFDGEKFVTLRYRWHAPKGEFEDNKYGKTIIDVSRIPEESLRTKALNIHRPLVYHCRKDPQPYSTSLFRVNHYLDSYEAYSYRNDVRSKLRRCKECYEKKDSGAAVSADNDIRPWLQEFVNQVGYEKAQRLLSNAGEFVKLQTPQRTKN